MKKVIQVTQKIRANEYNSLSEATAASDRESIDKNKASLINGKVVVNYQFDGLNLILEFNNGNYLKVFAGINSVEWDVLLTKPTISDLNLQSNISFEFPSGDQVFWNWKAIFNSFIGKQVAISPSDQFLFIFSRGGKEYIFNHLVNKNDPDDHYLYIGEV
ncbi:hypothetical protein [Spartinivicinus poritis]|uniref:Uncharacterized protein n=1 Tax=Spartinivicinus poritis TaxID=2994640 RepID=A0ABT5U3Y7_9GAMM|nr:hypothetical protein [Spartinivicinus sp. A2-2]MDE1461027.1 hypothetical protein [Spartinivicinus sp. A2-2]